MKPPTAVGQLSQVPGTILIPPHITIPVGGWIASVEGNGEKHQHGLV